MAYRVSIMDSGFWRERWWINFANSGEYPPATGLNAALAKFRAKDVPGTNFIEFESEDDFTMFLLQFA